MINVVEYLKERWLTYVFFCLAFVFGLVVYKLDVFFYVSVSNARYIVVGWLILLVSFACIDYGMLNRRRTRLTEYFSLRMLQDPEGEFSNPWDEKLAAIYHNLAVEYEQYKSKIDTQWGQQLEFVTKWLHDVKVPIAAAKLVLEQYETSIPPKCYQNIEQEMFIIEAAIEKIFYQIKAESFYEDYKITCVQTKQLIGSALKNYVNLFSYKSLQLRLLGDSYPVSTDEKWGSYILSQIISNAVKYTPINGLIEIHTENNANSTSIRIKNSGRGIAAHDIGQVFNRGYTSSEHRGGSNSTGYGLYLAKKLCDKLGHQLTVHSNYGQDVEFSLIFLAGQTLPQVTKL